MNHHQIKSWDTKLRSVVDVILTCAGVLVLLFLISGWLRACEPVQTAVSPQVLPMNARGVK